MEFLDNDNQLIAVEKVLDEMQYAEKILNSWNAFWWEEYQDVVLPREYLDSFAWDYFKLSDEDKAENLKIDKYIYIFENRGIPLKHFVLGGKYSCDVTTINWYGIVTNNSSRQLLFHNDGNIELNKESLKKPKKAHPNAVCYDANYNVLSNDFNISILLHNLTGDYLKKNKFTHFKLSLNDNILIEKYNNIEIIRDLNTGIRLIRIEKEQDERDIQDNSLVFEAVLNPDNSLVKGNIEINTYKGNGKVNGTYRFDVSRKNGICANFYSRKGNKLDLTTNPELLSEASKLLPSPNSQDSGDIIISSFANSIQNAISKNTAEEDINFDVFDFNIETVNKAEKRTMEMVKSIKGELPLSGLIDRIDNYLEIINNKENDQGGKVLKK